MSLFGVGRRYYRPFSRRFSARYSFNAFRARNGGHRYNRTSRFYARIHRMYGSLHL